MRDADIEGLAEIQRQSYARAGATLRGAWPEDTAMRTDELRDLLETLVYGVLATSRSDGRAHATPIAFSFEERTFWIATVAGLRLRNLRLRPWAALVLSEGQREGGHRALTVEGPVVLWEGGDFETARERLDAVWATRHGRPPDWAAAFIQLKPERVLSYRDRGA
jgi:nitroimidazol reductase NimA-like FMN-containing flavoprotein (pyridoxamine 5'-phosphate oxidase superfamily)